MVKIPKIIVFNDYISSVCAFWRSQYPLSLLARQGLIRLYIGDYGKEDWTTLSSCDIAFFQRPMSKNVKDQVLMAKDMGLKVIVDLDDYNFISPSHPVYNVWCDQYSEKVFEKIMMVTDVVITTTKELQKHYLTYNNNVQIVPNSVDNNWLKFKPCSKRKIVVLRAGEHHLQDVWIYQDEIVRVLNDHKDWEFVVIGGDINFLKNKVKYILYEDMDIHQYFATILGLNAAIFIVPLEDNKLNRCKSNISFQEAAISGAVALTPYWWNLHNCSVTYRDKKSFADGLEKLITDCDLRQDLHAKAIKKINANYLLSDANKQRMKIINGLIK
jgi:spore maturation protein CgeB